MRFYKLSDKSGDFINGRMSEVTFYVVSLMKLRFLGSERFSVHCTYSSIQLVPSGLLAAAGHTALEPLVTKVKVSKINSTDINLYRLK